MEGVFWCRRCEGRTQGLDVQNIMWLFPNQRTRVGDAPLWRWLHPHPIFVFYPSREGRTRQWTDEKRGKSSKIQKCFSNTFYLTALKQRALYIQYRNRQKSIPETRPPAAALFSESRDIYAREKKNAKPLERTWLDRQEQSSQIGSRPHCPAAVCVRLSRNSRPYCYIPIRCSRRWLSFSLSPTARKGLPEKSFNGIVGIWITRNMIRDQNARSLSAPFLSLSKIELGGFYEV